MDMLRAMEDLLDTWPGTLIVVSHDRYLLERITDQQYAIVDGEFRHVPGGVDQYLQWEQAHSIKRDSKASEVSTPASSAAPVPAGSLRPGSKEHREAEKEHALLRRKISKLATELVALDHAVASMDQSDYEALGKLGEKRAGLESERQAQEEKWLELEIALER